jgi:hypothetical protein
MGLTATPYLPWPETSKENANVARRCIGTRIDLGGSTASICHQFPFDLGGNGSVEPVMGSASNRLPITKFWNEGCSSKTSISISRDDVSDGKNKRRRGRV